MPTAGLLHSLLTTYEKAYALLLWQNHISDAHLRVPLNVCAILFPGQDHLNDKKWTWVHLFRSQPHSHSAVIAAAAFQEERHVIVLSSLLYPFHHSRLSVAPGNSQRICRIS